MSEPCDKCCPESELTRCADRVDKAGKYKDRVGVVVAFAVIGLLAAACMLVNDPQEDRPDCYDPFLVFSAVATAIVFGVAFPVYFDFTEVYGETSEEDPDWTKELNRTRKGVLGSCVAVFVVVILLFYSRFRGEFFNEGVSEARYIISTKTPLKAGTKPTTTRKTAEQQIPEAIEYRLKIPEKYLVIALMAALFVLMVVSARMLAVMHQNYCEVPDQEVETLVSYYCPEE